MELYFPGDTIWLRNQLRARKRKKRQGNAGEEGETTKNEYLYFSWNGGLFCTAWTHGFS